MKHDIPGERLANKHVVLLGVGHTNAHVVRQWRMNPIPGADLTCISDNEVATYSGMLPAVLSGRVPSEAMQIDLVRLCSSVGARLITSEVTGIDLPRQMIQFADRPAIYFDALSIGIGSVPTVHGIDIEGSLLLKIKPMQTFLQRLELALGNALQKLANTATGDVERPLKVLIAGSGVAGVEIAFCLPGFLKRKISNFSLQLVSRSEEILQDVIPSMRKRVSEELAKRAIAVKTGATIVAVTDDEVLLNNGQAIPADLVVWTTGASPPELLSKLNLPLNSLGFLATDSTLRSTSRRPIFAVGDTGTIVDEKLPKAGVYAVRQGPVLWENIKATLAERELTEYKPQRSFLKLLNTGDGRAIGEWKGFSFSGGWVMWLKDRIDRGFMQMYRVADVTAATAEQMQCKGCGCKLGGDVLAQVLLPGGNVVSVIGADQLDDAAVITMAAGQVIASTDFFTSPLNDAYLSGRIIALHSASDLVAMGASVKAALANVVVPEGEPVSQRRVLSDLLQGAREEFSAMGAEIVGGHTIVGPQWEVGFAVIGEPPVNGRLLRKGNLQMGDLLYVTKPLGTGVLLAAHMQSQCKAVDYKTLIEALLQRQHVLASIASEIGINAGTDITGFGLAGHLIEMLKASHKSATIDLSQLPQLPGAADAIMQGIESTLAPKNRSVESSVMVSARQRLLPAYKLLFDPQTCGGLLLGVSPAIARLLQDRIADSGIGICVRVGEVCSDTDGNSKLRIV